MTSKEPIKLAEAAKRLGISKQAAQQRIDRGQLDAYKDDKGRWWVPWPPDGRLAGDLVGDDEPPTSPAPTSALPIVLSSLVESQEELRAAVESQQATINRQQADLQHLLALLEQQQVRQPSRDEWIVTRMRELLSESERPKRPWWKWWGR